MEKKGKYRKSVKLNFIAMAFFTFSIVCAIVLPESDFVITWMIGFPALISIFVWMAAVAWLFVEHAQAKKNKDENLEQKEEQNIEVQGKVCKYCGTENDIEDKKCHTCGAGLKRISKKKKD